jgi:hypothetical protein
MKKYLVLTAVVLSLGYAVAVVVRFLGLTSINVFDVSVLIGGGTASGLVALALCDYARKPRFRARQSRGRPAATAPSSAVDPVTLWTYTTRSS